MMELSDVLHEYVPGVGLPQASCPAAESVTVCPCIRKDGSAALIPTAEPAWHGSAIVTT
jgi:hypothetical protein